MSTQMWDRAFTSTIPDGRPHPIEKFLTTWLTSTCTDVAVRTHVPVRVGLDVVWVPVAGADELMRGIAREVWPNDPSPLEEQGYCAGRAEDDEAYLRGFAAGYKASCEDGVKVAEDRVTLSMDMLLASAGLIADVVRILETGDGDRVAAALRVLRGGGA